MKRFLVSALAVLSMGLTLAACGGSDSDGGVVGGFVASSLKDARKADLSGQQSVFTGTLGSGVSFTFPAVKGQGYLISVDTNDPADIVVFDVGGDDGSGLRSKSVDSGQSFMYQHENKSQHVLVIARPRNPFNTDVGVTKMTVTGMGSYATDRFHVNFIVAGKFSGLGAHNDLTTAADQGAFTDAVMAKVQTLFTQTGIGISYEGFAFTGDDIRAKNGSLVAADDQTTCHAGESVSGSGFEIVDRQGLNAWGQLGFDENDPVFNRGHGINVFIIHHFTNDGTVGLSPRPGVLVGKGDDTALCVAAFLGQNGTYIPRTVDEIATVLAHEIGHFLGLLHTTTFQPDPLKPTEAVDDGITDTPKCDVLTDVNGDGRVGLGDGCPDENNVMFYQAGLQTVFSTGQADIMKQVLSAQEH